MIKIIKFLLFVYFISNIHFIQAMEKPTPPKKPTFLIDEMSVDDASPLSYQQESRERAIADQYNQALAEYQKALAEWEAMQRQQALLPLAHALQANPKTLPIPVVDTLRSLLAGPSSKSIAS